MFRFAQKIVDWLEFQQNKPILRKIYLLIIQFRSFAIHVRKFGDNFSSQLLHAIQTNKIDLVIDGGANEGQFALDLLRTGYKGTIISIEPLSDSYKKLQAQAKRFKKWQIFPRMAIGDKDGEIEINVSKNFVSSSLLKILPLHVNSAPESKYVNKEKADIHKLDHFMNDFRKYKNILLKIDTQGYESYILKGAEKLIDSKNLKGIIMEVSFSKLYENQQTFGYFYEYLIKKKFVIWGIEGGFKDKKIGRMFQANLLAFKE